MGGPDDPVALAVSRLRLAGVPDADAEVRESQARAYAATYLGTLPIAAATLGSNLWAMFGAQIAGDAAKKLKKLKRTSPVNAVATVSVDGVNVSDALSEDVMDAEAMRSVAYSCVVPGDAKKAAYITRYDSLGLLYCHVLQMKTKAMALEFSSAVLRLKEEAKKAREAVDELEPHFGFGECRTTDPLSSTQGG